MDSLTLPGIDGYNVHFYKKWWHIIGPSFVPDVHEFFVSGFMPKLLNCTYVSLLAKISNASSVKDFRPIACCSVLYKIVSKTITNRMQGVLNELMSEANMLSFKVELFFITSC